MEFLSLHFPVSTEPASLTLLLSLRKLFSSPLPTHIFNPNNIWELQPLSYKRETDLEVGGWGGETVPSTLNNNQIPTAKLI